MDIEKLISLGVLLIITFIFFIYIFLMRQKNFKKYWLRPCTGRKWKQEFPNASKHEIRRFLTIFIDAFGFKPKQRLKFLPSDKVMDIYRAIYFDRGLPDAMELESFVQLIEYEYNIDMFKLFNKELTLGKIFTLTRRENTKK